MRSQVLSGGASVGLSALLAGFLLVAANRHYPAAPVASFEMQTEPAAPPPGNTQRPADASAAVVLPPPPPPTIPDNAKNTAKLSKAPMKSLVATKNKPAPAIVPIRPGVKQPAPMVAVRPLLPSPSVPNDDVSDPMVEGVLEPPIENAYKDAKAKKAFAIVRPGEQTALVEQGRVLLRMLEHGRGPAIELAWPDRAGDQEQLYQTLRDCLGMRVALRDGAGRLYIANSPTGQAWRPNIDRYSGFARQPTGRLAAAERRDILNIGQHHNLSRQTRAIRIFPRRVDAQLLGGLRRLVGERYGRAHNIRAKYRLFADGVTIMGILVDGRSIAGGVALAAPARSGCRAG
jgi:hypothetical protein